MPFAPHILFPVDFSELCTAVRPSVISMAHHFQAEVTLIHILQIPAAWSRAMDMSPQITLDFPAMVQDGRQKLAEFFGTPEPALSVRTVVETGDPAACITRYAEQHGVGLIMIATHGYGKFRRLLLGSVTAKVLHDAKCAVWTSAHIEDPALAGRIHVRRILCAVGVEPENVRVIYEGAALARSFNAQLRLVHAVSFFGAAGPDFASLYPVGVGQSLLEPARDRIAKMQEQAGTTADLCLEFGSVSGVVRAAAQQSNADLVVIGRGKLQDTLGTLRTNAYAIIRDSPCPVLSV